MITVNTVSTFFLSAEELENSPSRKHGIDRDTEATLRTYGCELIQECGMLLAFPQAAVATAQVLLHRFYCKRSLKDFNIKVGCGAHAQQHRAAWRRRRRRRRCPAPAARRSHAPGCWWDAAHTAALLAASCCQPMPRRILPRRSLPPPQCGWDPSWRRCRRYPRTRRPCCARC